MRAKGSPTCTERLLRRLEELTRSVERWIAAVSGYALGGGCEVAMMADFIVAADSAKFGQPEIKLGVTPGMGGRSAWRTPSAGPSGAEMCLTGAMMKRPGGARRARPKVVPAADLLDEAMKTAEAIAASAALTAVAVRKGRRRPSKSGSARASASSGRYSTACSGPRISEGRHGRLRRKAAGQRG